MANSIKFGILTVSDRCFAGQAEDKSRPALCKLIEALVPSAKIVKSSCVPDEEDEIIQVLKEWTEGEEAVDVLLTTGGTGFAARDVTPEATRKVLQKEAPAMAAAMTVCSLTHTPLAMLSRAACGLREGALIVNLPGSPKGACECFEAIAMTVPHAVAVARGRQVAVTSQHHDLRNKHSSHRCRHHHHSCGKQHASTPASVPARSTCGGHHSDGDKQRDVGALGDALSAPLARRLRSSPFPMVSVDSAQNMIRELTQDVFLGEDNVPAGATLGRVLAQSVNAPEPLPPFEASLKDGYAVLAADGSGPRKVVAVSAAGHESGLPSLKPGECARINTGASLPPGADAIVQVEDTRLLKEADGGVEELEVEILVTPVVGLDVRPAGSDIARGQEVLSAGTVMSPAEVGLLCGAGLVSVPVRRLPSVALLSTGDELVDPCTRRKGIPDTNRPTLAALLCQHGFKAITDLGIAKDSRESMREHMRRGLSCADVLVTSGSVSMGDRDFLKHVLLGDFQATIHFGRVNMKPGKPTTFASVEFEGKRRFVLGLPGNPVSATVTANLFLLPLLKMLSGHPHPLPTIVKASMEGDFPLDPRPEYHRVTLTWSPDKDLPIANSTGSQASSRLLSMAGACALAILPGASETRTVLTSGTPVDTLLLREI